MSDTPPPLNVVKIAAWIPVTREILQDAGYQGSLAKNTPEAERWRRIWHEQQRRVWGGASGFIGSLYSPPPWENPDRPVLPQFELWRTPALFTRVATWWRSRCPEEKYDDDY